MVASLKFVQEHDWTAGNEAALKAKTTQHTSSSFLPSCIYSYSSGTYGSWFMEPSGIYKLISLPLSAGEDPRGVGVICPAHRRSGRVPIAKSN